MKATPQKYWDMLLIDGWAGERKLGNIVGDFADYVEWPEDRDMNILELFDGIARGLTLHHIGEMKKPVRYFFHLHLPKCSEMLWAGVDRDIVETWLWQSKLRKTRMPGTSARAQSSYDNKKHHARNFRIRTEVRGEEGVTAQTVNHRVKRR